MYINLLLTEQTEQFNKQTFHQFNVFFNREMYKINV